MQARWIRRVNGVCGRASPLTPLSTTSPSAVYSLPSSWLARNSTSSLLLQPQGCATFVSIPNRIAVAAAPPLPPKPRKQTRKFPAKKQPTSRYGIQDIIKLLYTFYPKPGTVPMDEHSVHVYDTFDRSPFTDFVVIVLASSVKQMRAISAAIHKDARSKDACRENKRILSVSGRSDDEWQLVDIGYIMVHVLNTNAPSRLNSHLNTNATPGKETALRDTLKRFKLGIETIDLLEGLRPAGFGQQEERVKPLNRKEIAKLEVELEEERRAANEDRKEVERLKTMAKEFGNKRYFPPVFVNIEHYFGDCRVPIEKHLGLKDYPHGLKVSDDERSAVVDIVELADMQQPVEAAAQASSTSSTA